MRRVKEKEEMSRTNTPHCQQAQDPNYDQNDQCDQNVHDDLKNCNKVFSTYNCCSAIVVVKQHLSLFTFGNNFNCIIRSIIAFVSLLHELRALHELNLKSPLPPIKILLTFFKYPYPYPYIHIAGDLFWKI